MNQHRIHVKPGRCLLLLILWSLTSGCASLLESGQPTPVSYVLAPVPAPDQAVAAPTTRVDLAIGRPDVGPGLDTQRIAVLRGRQLDYYRGVQWGARTADVVQTLVVASLQDQRMFRSVTTEQARVSGEYLLDLEVRDFQAEYAAAEVAPTVRVGVVGRLIRIRDRGLLATVVASTTRPASQNRVGDVVAAFESAAQWVALELARQSSAALAREPNSGGTDEKEGASAR